jgi:hypothetical protein
MTSDQPDDSEPSPERQTELRAAYDKNVAAGKAPYEGVRVRTRGELQWVMRERGWTDSPLYEEGQKRADLRGAVFYGANLSHTGFFLADLRGADFGGANLSGADLRASVMDVTTKLALAIVDTQTLLADVKWDGVALTHVDWPTAHRVGDEQFIAKAQNRMQLRSAYRDAVRTYRQLATALRGQGMNDDADRYAERGQVMQRRLYGREGHLGRWAFWLLLEVMAGYGYRLSRILIAYALVLTVFAAIFYAVGLPVPPTTHLTTLQAVADAFQLSLTAVHGRVFFEQLGLGSAVAWTAAIESVFGIVIEGVFVAMLIQRFFGR